ncbi:hypothetical protein [Streptomyces sp. NBC_01340]|uniref:hypothetical protein n=1 Tax=Streptomyces sp. NBC_01340 TaxID=2903830 RepID=UPI003DA2DF1E
MVSEPEWKPDPRFAGVPAVVPRPLTELAPLIDWLRDGRPAGERLDFTAGTALPDGRLDLCKQGLGARGAALVAEALSEMSTVSDGPSPVRHLLLGTDALGDEGAAAVAARAEVETLYLGCNGITAGGACRIADNLRASPRVVTGVWLKRNPLGSGGGRAARTARELGERLRRQAHEGDPDVLLAVVRRLGAHGGHGEGLLAAAVTGAIGARTGWAAPWRERLRALRRHPVADVRDVALDQVTAYE